MAMTTEQYLKEVSKGLGRMPEVDKADIMNEIESHISEAVRRQLDAAYVLQRLGPPQKLAQSYLHSYSLENDVFKPSDLFDNFAFYFSAAMAGVMIIPALSITAVTLVGTSVFILAVAILNVVGVINMPFNAGTVPVTGISQIVMAVVFAVIMCAIAGLCWKALKKYMQYISRNYRSRRMKD